MGRWKRWTEEESMKEGVCRRGGIICIISERQRETYGGDSVNIRNTVAAKDRKILIDE